MILRFPYYISVSDEHNNAIGVIGGWLTREEFVKAFGHEPDIRRGKWFSYTY